MTQLGDVELQLFPREVYLDEPIPGFPEGDTFPLLADVQKTKKVSRGFFSDLAIGILKSRIFKSLVTAALAGILCSAIFYPAGWVIALVVILTLLLTLAAQLPGKGWQKFTFEISTIARLLKSKNYNEIFALDPQNGPRIILGALPNRLSLDGERLVNQEEIGAVLSVNEDWEKTPTGFSVPYTAEDWAELGIKGDDYKQIRVNDHKPLSEEQFHEVADWIQERLAKGKSVYVHCRGGNGRSAMAIAAYLIKHRKMHDETEPIQAVQRAESTILLGRPISTIRKKRDHLVKHAESCTNLFSNAGRI